jgi:quercetin dioxygenase-like cupin family protein
MFGKQSVSGYQESLPGILQKTLVWGEKTLMTEFILEKGSVLPLHSHPNEQTGYLVEGHLTLTVGEEAHEIFPGDSWSIPGNVVHFAEVHQDSKAIEIFSPVRTEYIPLVKNSYLP